MTRRCPDCNAPRKGEQCWKCSAETFEPSPEWVEPALPPIERIRALAREVGYAIGVHGSQERDLDLIAAPWIEDAIGPTALMEHIAAGIGAGIIDIERKPLGRYAATLQMEGWFKDIDLSVCPHAPRRNPMSDKQKAIAVGDVVRLQECGDSERDLMCAGFLATVVELDGGMAFVDSDKPKVRQAVSFRQWWPVDRLGDATHG